MLRTVRRGVFETNSSSTHSLTIVSKEDFDKFERGELLMDRGNDCLIEIPEGYDSDDDVGEDYCTAEQYFEDEYLESFVERHTTPNGEKIVAFGLFGHD